MEIIIQKDEYYPKRLLQIQNPPERLYVEGNEKLLRSEEHTSELQSPS